MKGDKYKSLLLYGNRLSPSASLVRKEFLLQNDVRFNENSDFVTVEDYDYWLQLALSNATFKFVRSFEGEYLVHGTNSSSYAEIHKRNGLYLLKHHVFNVQEFATDKDKLWIDIQAVASFREAFQRLESDGFPAFLRTSCLSLLSSPSFLSKWILFKFKFYIENRFIAK